MQNIPNLPSQGFLGSMKYNVDSKNRITIPPDFISILDVAYKFGHRSVITFFSLNRSIAVFPVASYDHFLQSIQKKSILDKNMRRLLTMIQGSSSVQTIDSQNRLRLSEELLKHSGIVAKKGSTGEGDAREAYVKGFGDHIEIWAVPVWDKYIEETLEKVEDISDEVSRSSSDIEPELN